MHIDIRSLKTFKVSGPSSYCSVIGKSTECSMMMFRCVIHVQMLLLRFLEVWLLPVLLIMSICHIMISESQNQKSLTSIKSRKESMVWPAKFLIFCVILGHIWVIIFWAVVVDMERNWYICLLSSDTHSICLCSSIYVRNCRALFFRKGMKL